MICNPRQGSCGIPVLAVVATMAVIPLMAQESLEGVARPDTTRPNTHYVRKTTTLSAHRQPLFSYYAAPVA